MTNIFCPLFIWNSTFLVHIKSKLFSFVLLLESMGRSEAKA